MIPVPLRKHCKYSNSSTKQKLGLCLTDIVKKQCGLTAILLFCLYFLHKNTDSKNSSPTVLLKGSPRILLVRIVHWDEFTPVHSFLLERQDPSVHQYLDPDSCCVLFIFLFFLECADPFSAPAGPVQAPTDPGVDSPGSTSPLLVACSDLPEGS